MSSTTYNSVNATAASLSKRQVAASADRSNVAGTGIWVGIFAITMSFAAFTSALFVRQGSANDWVHLSLPPILYANTIVLLLSSATLMMSRRALGAAGTLNAESAKSALLWLVATLALGLFFVAGQYDAWHQLAVHGLFIATNPNSSFFYVFTGIHALHVFGGLAALVYLIGRLSGSHITFRRSTFESTAIYWHFMGALWLYLFLLLRAKL